MLSRCCCEGTGETELSTMMIFSFRRAVSSVAIYSAMDTMRFSKSLRSTASSNELKRKNKSDVKFDGGNTYLEPLNRYSISLIRTHIASDIRSGSIMGRVVLLF